MDKNFPQVLVMPEILRSTQNTGILHGSVSQVFILSGILNYIKSIHNESCS